MSHITLRCTACAATHDADMATLRCGKCDAPLDVEYTSAASDIPGPQPRGWNGPRIPLPIHGTDALVSLGEGNTPCVKLATLGELLGLRSLYAKLELLNPTGSFKDRGAAIMVSVARKHGVREIVEDSSGNAGASVSACAARAGIRAHIFAPAGAPQAKIKQIRVYGAQAHLVEGPREAAGEAALRYCTDGGLVYASHSLSPYFAEGTKTFAYELAQQFPTGVPGHVVIPVGNGSLVIGAWNGFRELLQAGHIDRMPRLHCIQARSVMPVVAAYRGEEWLPKPATATIAGGIAVGAPPRKQQVLDILRRSNGVALAVEDDEISKWHRLLAEKEGIYAEPTSAAAFAGLERLVDQGDVPKEETVLLPVTGSGLKDTPPG